ncbi:MAG TPA: NnrU family protein [Burkholderiales bacterium]
MATLAAATALFLLTHFVPSTPLRPALVGAIGEGRYRGLYVLVAFATLGWMAWAYAHAPAQAPLWTPLRHLPLVVMPFSLVLVVGGLVKHNPTAVGAERMLKEEEPARGMIRITRHPFMWGAMLWAAAHILANADAKSTVFFGAFLVLAGLGTVLIDRRKRSLADWPRFAARTSNVPFLAIAQGRNRVVWSEIGWARPAIALALYALLVAVHPWLFGVRPY